MPFSACSFDGLLRGRPGKPAIAGIASTHFSNILESSMFAPLTSITSGMPLACSTMCRLEPSFPVFVSVGPASWLSGAWYRGAINAGPAPIDLVMFTRASQHGLVQLLPTPAAFQSRRRRQQVMPLPYPRDWGEVFPWNACLQNEQDAVEGGFIAHCKLASTAVGRWHALRGLLRKWC